ncbi:MAG: hypothetical protein V3R56_08090 [Xanthomonadales bacterium]
MIRAHVLFFLQGSVPFLQNDGIGRHRDKLLPLTNDWANLRISLFYKDYNEMKQIVPERNLCVIAELAPDGKFSVQISQQFAPATLDFSRNLRA